MQDAAPEVLTLHVRTVTVTGPATARAVTAIADVTAVTRTATGRRVGDAIRLHYVTTEPARDVIGTAPVPVPKPDAVCPAYLKQQGDTYTPVAGGFSFTFFDDRAGAGEVLVLRITATRTEKGPPRPSSPEAVGDEAYNDHFLATAVVREVRHSVSGRRPGEAVDIEWTIDDDSPPTPLVAGDTYVAWLHQRSNSKILYPAALHCFEPFRAPATRPSLVPSPGVPGEGAKTSRR